MDWGYLCRQNLNWSRQTRPESLVLPLRGEMLTNYFRPLQPTQSAPSVLLPPALKIISKPQFSGRLCSSACKMRTTKMATSLLCPTLNAWPHSTASKECTPLLRARLPTLTFSLQLVKLKEQDQQPISAFGWAKLLRTCKSWQVPSTCSTTALSTTT